MLGIEALVKETKLELKQKTITILCNHEIFAKPFHYLYGENNQVQVTTLDDPKHQEKCHEADVLIIAIGKPKYIDNKFIKDNAVVIDVGINELAGETVGDVDFDNALLKASYITPVPGGVGPMTIAFLLKNILQLAENQS